MPEQGCGGWMQAIGDIGWPVIKTGLVELISLESLLNPLLNQASPLKILTLFFIFSNNSLQKEILKACQIIQDKCNKTNQAKLSK